MTLPVLHTNYRYLPTDHLKYHHNIVQNAEELIIKMGLLKHYVSLVNTKVK